MPEIQSLEHAPFGLMHPYLQEPQERTPRQPLAGQPTTLGAVTRPAGSAERMTARWTTAGGGAGQAEGVLVEHKAEQDCWKVELPAFAALEKVRYTVFATGPGGRELKSEEFSFTAAAWVSTGGAVSAQVEPGGIRLAFAGSDLAVSLALQFPSPDRLHVGWQAGAGRAELPAAGGEYQVVRQDEKGLLVRTQALEVELDLQPFQLSVRRAGDGRVLFEQDVLPEWLLGADRCPLQLRQSFPCPAGEGFYGFGERYNALNQRGNHLDVRVYEQYKHQGLKTYIPAPYCFSPRGWGLYLNTARRVDYDLAASQAERWSWAVELGPQASLEYDLIFGSPLELAGAFTQITGRPKLPPAWIYGPWMSANEWNSQAEVMRQLELTRRHAIPVSVLVIEAWSDEATFYIWNDAQYTPHSEGRPFHYSEFSFPAEGKWPDPKGMIESLHAQDIRLVLWQIPALKQMEPHPQHDLDTAYALSQGYCVRNPDGSPYRIRPFWFNDGYLWDPTHPAGRDWWLEQRAYLLDELGVDGFKTDGGEHLWSADAFFANGLRADEGINLYPNLYVGAYHQFASRKRNGEAITFSRAGFGGAQAFPCHWAGDQSSSWSECQAQLRAGLNAGLSGMPFWGFDIGGFAEEIPSAELYLRSAAMAAFSPIMQYHSDYFQHSTPSHDRSPWNMAERTGRPEVIDIYRKLARLRQRLRPYIEAEAAHAAASGEPLMRPLLLDWPEDPLAWGIEDQYCFGRALLVAPVLEEGASQRRVYLPAGEWLDVWTGDRQSGPAWVECPAPWESIPVFQRLGQAGPALEMWNEEKTNRARPVPAQH